MKGEVIHLGRSRGTISISRIGKSSKPWHGGEEGEGMTLTGLNISSDELAPPLPLVKGQDTRGRVKAVLWPGDRKGWVQRMGHRMGTF